MKRCILGAGLAILAAGPALSQTYRDSLGVIVPGVAPLVGCATTGFCLGPVSSSNPLPVTGALSTSGFTPSSVGAPISANTSGAGAATGTLPAGAVVVATNVGTTNGAYCALGASSSTSQQYIGPNGGWFAFTIPAGATQMTCVTANATTMINLVGGSGLPTGAAAGGSSIASWGGGTLGAMANFGTSPGPVLAPGMNAYVIANAIEGTLADAPCALPATTANCSLVAIAKAGANAVSGPIPAGSANIGGVELIDGGGVNKATVKAASTAAAAADSSLVVAISPNSANLSAPINISTATTTLLVPASGLTAIYVSAYDIIAGGAGSVTIEYGAGANCSSGTTALTGPYPLMANSGISKGSGVAPLLKAPPGNALCVVTSTPVQYSGSITFQQF